MFEGLKVSATWVGVDTTYGHTDKWRVTISRNGKRMQVPFMQGSFYKGQPPTVEAVMESVVNDAQYGLDDFDDFCSNLGMDEDSREAMRVWKLCKSIGERLPKVITAEEWEKITEGSESTMEALRAIETKNN